MNETIKCPKCQHDIETTSSMDTLVCPNCGYGFLAYVTIDGERLCVFDDKYIQKVQLLQAKRLRKMRVTVSILMCAVAVAAAGLGFLFKNLSGSMMHVYTSLPVSVFAIIILILFNIRVAKTLKKIEK